MKIKMKKRRSKRRKLRSLRRLTETRDQILDMSDYATTYNELVYGSGDGSPVVTSTVGSTGGILGMMVGEGAPTSEYYTVSTGWGISSFEASFGGPIPEEEPATPIEIKEDYNKWTDE